MTSISSSTLEEILENLILGNMTELRSVSLPALPRVGNRGDPWAETWRKGVKSSFFMNPLDWRS